MNLLCLILLMSSAALWFFTVEHDRLFGIYYPTCAISRRSFFALIFASVLISEFFCSCGSVGSAVCLLSGDTGIGCMPLMVMLVASFIALSALKFFSIKGSFIYAALGSALALNLISGDSMPHWHIFLSFVAAPLMAFAIAWLIRLLEKAIFARTDIHLITLSYYMRYAIVLGVILTGTALGFNWGGFMTGLGCGLESDMNTLPVLLLATAVMLLAVSGLKKLLFDEPSGLFADFTVYAVVSTGFAVALTLLFFSFDSTSTLVGLHAVPLSVSSLVMAAVAGTETAQKSPLVDKQEYRDEIIAFLAAPLGSFLLTYIIMSVMGADAQNLLDDFAVMAAAIAVLMALGFAGYVRRQKFQREVTDRLVYTQQQQIYEHSRALNDMELKVVLSENQALHNAVEMKRQEVMNVALSIVEQRDYLESLNELVTRLAKTDEPKEKDKVIAELRSSLQQRLSYDRDVDSQYFYAQAESLHEDFNAKLSENFPNLTQQERRLATLLRLGFSSKYIATLMNITTKSVEISRYRLRQKLGLSKGDNLVNYIKSI